MLLLPGFNLEHPSVFIFLGMGQFQGEFPGLFTVSFQSIGREILRLSMCWFCLRSTRYVFCIKFFYYYVTFFSLLKVGYYFFSLIMKLHIFYISCEKTAVWTGNAGETPCSRERYNSLAIKAVLTANLVLFQTTRIIYSFIKIRYIYFFILFVGMHQSRFFDSVPDSDF